MGGGGSWWAGAPCTVLGCAHRVPSVVVKPARTSCPRSAWAHQRAVWAGGRGAAGPPHGRPPSS
eukprot:197841-Pleurochrysis_carterae.AAC.1